jgi:hypothetical protein
MAGIDVVRPMLGMLALAIWRINYEIADETGPGPEVLFGNLMTYRAGDAIRGRGGVLLIGIERKVWEYHALIPF